MVNMNELGPASWYNFHTLAEKAKPEHFNKLKKEIIDNFVAMCNNLPCPECRGHAVDKINLIDFKKIKNQSDLKLFFLGFHNSVNLMNSKPLFSEDELNEKYANANLLAIHEYFMTLWKIPTNNSKLMMDAFHKERFLTKYNKWFNDNKDKFYL